MVAKDEKQYRRLAAPLERSGLYSCKRVFNQFNLRGAPIAILFVLPKAWFSVRAKDRQDIVQLARIKRIKIFEFTNTRFERTIQELEADAQKLEVMLVSGPDSDSVPNSSDS